jgi:hypothetical protein
MSESDDVQKITKPGSKKHAAFLNLHTQSFCLLSSTLVNTKWDDFASLLAFAKHHPFHDPKVFTGSFCVAADGPTETGPALKTDQPHQLFLQRFLQAIVVARPAHAYHLANLESNVKMEFKDAERKGPVAMEWIMHGIVRHHYGPPVLQRIPVIPNRDADPGMDVIAGTE